LHQFKVKKKKKKRNQTARSVNLGLQLLYKC
jgi:hypothetical protein